MKTTSFMFLKKSIVLALLLMYNFALGYENNAKIEYKVVYAKEIANFFENAPKNISLNELYVIGYISQDTPVKHDISCTAYFYNKDKKGLKRIANLGFIGNGKFFILQLGSDEIYDKDLVYELKVDFRK